jgi:xylulokinase
MEYLIGIDIGTTHIKASVFDIHGKEAAAAILPTPATVLGAETVIYDPQVLWSTLCGVLSRVLSDLDKKETPSARGLIAGIAVASMAESGVPLNSCGKPLYPIISWFDSRTKTFLAYWKNGFGQDKVFDITGQRLQHIFTVNKILWLKKNEPDVFKNMKHWLGVDGYISYRLTGEYSMDFSQATRTMMLDIRSGRWSKEILDKTGINAAILPPLKQSGTCIGEITEEAAAQTGLKKGTRVYAGGHDHICSAFAVGAFEKGIFMDSSGTAEPVLTALTDIEPLLMFGSAGYSVGNHVAKDRFYVYGSITSSGATVDWYQKEFMNQYADMGVRTAGANGLLFLPHLRGSSSPTRDPISKGAFLGIRTYHTYLDFSQAVYDGLGFELKQIIEIISNGESPKKMIAVGGGTKNSIWMQTKADILGMPIEVPVVQEGTAMGAALLAGMGAGVYRDGKEAVAKTYRVGTVIEPESKNAAIYCRLYETYRKLFKALYEINCDLEQLP